MTKQIRLLPRWLAPRNLRQVAQGRNFNHNQDISAQRGGNFSDVQVIAVGLPAHASDEDPYETLCCLKWGAHYGVISEAAYESGKADLLAASLTFTPAVNDQCGADELRLTRLAIVLRTTQV